MAVLEARDLVVEFAGRRVLRGVSLDVESGRTLGVVGESGCGKSMTGLALMGMVPGAGRLASGSIRLEGRELVGQSERAWRAIRGAEIAMVMQDPFTSLNPMMRVGEQVAEVLRLHRGMSGREAEREALAMLGQVGIPDPPAAARKYPHQMSGGQRQRIVLAIAFACRPKVLIADEPTTALDVTTQAQILRLIRDLQAEHGTGVMLISHDVGVIGAVAERVAVLYAGRVVEEGSAESVLRAPRHPYTQALLAAMPSPGRDRLAAIGGQPPDFGALPSGCSFGPRCAQRFDRCAEEPGLLGPKDRRAACWLPQVAERSR
jgi:oligopeptide/dipeptide ABC transporter ATP-binding protein